jgi:hypothetical protein
MLRGVSTDYNKDEQIALLCLGASRVLCMVKKFGE